MSKKNKKLPFSLVGKYKFEGHDEHEHKKKDLVKILRKTKADIEKKAYCNHKDTKQNSHMKRIGENLLECEICHAVITTDKDMLTPEGVQSAVILLTTVLNKFRTSVGLSENMYNDITHAMEYIYKAPMLLEALNELDKRHGHADDEDDHHGKKHKKDKKKHKKGKKHHKDNDGPFNYKVY